MEVTEVSRIRGKVRLIIGSESILITKKLYEERPLAVGDEVDLEEYDRFLLLHQYRPALDHAVSMLSARPCASKEIESSLKRIGYRPQTIEMVLYKLSSNDLLDDAAFARQWAASRAHRLGKQRIAMELKRKGVAEEEAEAALEDIDENEQLENARELAEKGLRKAKAGEDPRKTLQRVTAMLVRRGYSYSLAHEAIQLALKES